jgi:dTDP-4-dehydrorhamnose 3,5-epimerase
MHIRETYIEGLIELFPDIYKDDRGHFLETFHEEKFKSQGMPYQFVQTNQSFSLRGVLRGLHFQKPPHAQGKLVRVISGRVLDVVLDIRPESATYGQHMKVILDGERSNLLYVPEGMAHGFVALEDTTFVYQCTKLYHKSSESGVIWNDPGLAIDWELEKYGISEPIISDKDKLLPSFSEIK